MTGTKRAWFGVLVLFGVLLSSAPGWVDARYIGANRPCCATCESCGCSCGGPGTPSPKGNPASFNQARGTVSLCHDCGCGQLPFSLSYNSDNADGSRSYIDIGLGYGWTHNHGQLLFSQRGSMFLLDGAGQVTRFRRSGRTSYRADTGYYQTLTRNPDGSFTLKDLDDTTYEFARIPGDTTSVKGPVYKITSLTERNERGFEYDYDAAGRLSKVPTPPSATA
jgi:YD repeat-containing protein